VLIHDKDAPLSNEVVFFCLGQIVSAGIIFAQPPASIEGVEMVRS
jgi:hypothetical protein